MMIQSELCGDTQRIIGNELFVTYLIVPTQLLQYADGGNSEGFSTMYDFKILAKLPIGTMDDDGRVSTEARPFSPLLVKGRVVA